MGRFKGRLCGEFLEEAQQLLPHLPHERLLRRAQWLLQQDALRAECSGLVKEWRKAQVAVEAAEEVAEERSTDERRKKEQTEKKEQVEAGKGKSEWNSTRGA